jgi:hypothetical protein
MAPETFRFPEIMGSLVAGFRKIPEWLGLTLDTQSPSL